MLSLENKEFIEITKELRKNILDKEMIEFIKNPFKQYFNSNSNIHLYIKEPFGSQNFPDFLIFTKNYIFPLEIKFSNKVNSLTTPKWNSNIPKGNSIYLFANREKTNTPLLFFGNDYISNEIRNKMIKHFANFKEKQKLEKLLRDIQRMNNPYNPFGIYPKIRTDFLSSRQFIFGNDENLNIFDFAKKMKWVDNVFNTLQELVEEYEEE
ncbi:hypothetical protein [Mycoplasmopsis pullorum]|uniref:Type II restriction endonuclease n=1 Tax=Mycoplasmopsis pullorum TaxID=48003 RepID=A0A1L4FSY9_9BACT|nr:hypothetical protein [Mycoplasmopsis pullorum]APJ38692.1 hypothetical protein BLA55_03465 [Mycoplasmopsis pullorum]